MALGDVEMQHRRRFLHWRNDWHIWTATGVSALTGAQPRTRRRFLHWQRNRQQFLHWQPTAADEDAHAVTASWNNNTRETRPHSRWSLWTVCSAPNNCWSLSKIDACSARPSQLRGSPGGRSLHQILCVFIGSCPTLPNRPVVTPISVQKQCAVEMSRNISTQSTHGWIDHFSVDPLSAYFTLSSSTFKNGPAV